MAFPVCSVYTLNGQYTIHKNILHITATQKYKKEII